MRSDTRAIVVLAGVHKGEEGKKERDAFADIARAWKRGGRRFEQPVWFVWVEGETSRWANWLKMFYGYVYINDSLKCKLTMFGTGLRREIFPVSS